MKKLITLLSLCALFSTQAHEEKHKTAVVIGGGLAGLTAAYELEQKHYDVTLLEARDRLGGRVYSKTFDNNQIAEAGAELIDAKSIHPLMHEYSKKFNLTLADVGYDDEKIADGAYYLNGQLIPFDELEDKLGEKAAKDDEKFWDALYELGQKIPDATQPHLAPQAKELDNSNAFDWVKSLQLQASIEKLALHHIRSEYGEPKQLSLLFLAQQQKAYENIEDDEIEIHRIEGGNSLLAEAFAKQVKGNIHLNSPVNAITQSNKQVQVKTTDGKTYNADYAVVAIPASVLNHITFTPELPKTMQMASQLQLGHHNKAMLLYQKKFWLDRGLGGDVQSELPIGWVWEATDQQDGETGILITYTSGEVAEKESTLTDKEVLEKRRKEIETMYPEAKSLFVSGDVQRWTNDKWTQGGFAAYAPEQVIPFWTAFHQPHQLIYFAGEHTDNLLPGYMEGAIRSGQRAAKQMP